MKIFNLIVAVLFVAEIGVFSVQRLAAQTSAPHQQQMQCPGMTGRGMSMNGMSMNGMSMNGMHGPADHAYMQSMMTMHSGMREHAYTGNADHDFMVMMIPHHQAAIDMAKTELQYGTNPKLRAMAQSIIKAQQAEIDQMKALLQ